MKLVHINSVNLQYKKVILTTCTKITKKKKVCESSECSKEERKEVSIVSIFILFTKEGKIKY